MKIDSELLRLLPVQKKDGSGLGCVALVFAGGYLGKFVESQNRQINIDH